MLFCYVILQMDKGMVKRKFNRCYSCTSTDGGCTDLEHGESTIDCPAIKGCRIAKTLDNGHGDPTWVGQI